MSDPTSSPAGTDTERVIAERRTSLLVDPDVAVSRPLIERLIDAATWAPNHKRTWPWRFTVLTGNGRAALGQTMAEAGAGAGLPEKKVAKLRTKYLRSPVVLLVWHERQADDDAVRCREDRDAVAAATQNLLLAATAHGLTSYWGTVPDALVPAVRTVASVDHHHDLLALVYLGRPIGTVPPPVRPEPQVTWLS